VVVDPLTDIDPVSLAVLTSVAAELLPVINPDELTAFTTHSTAGSR
jgi:hypothetical protein